MGYFFVPSPPIFYILFSLEIFFFTSSSFFWTHFLFLLSHSLSFDYENANTVALFKNVSFSLFKVVSNFYHSFALSAARLSDFQPFLDTPDRAGRRERQRIQAQFAWFLHSSSFPGTIQDQRGMPKTTL
jgi:hypothetical protein